MTIKKEIKPKKITLKELIFQFVEGRESKTARFIDIQRFIVDTKYGKGTYDKGRHLEETFEWSKKEGKYIKVNRWFNTYRGEFSDAFNRYRGYLMMGRQYLVKDGKQYRVVRDGEWKKTPPRPKPKRFHYDKDLRTSAIVIPKKEIPKKEECIFWNEEPKNKECGYGVCYDSLGNEIGSFQEEKNVKSQEIKEEPQVFIVKSIDDIELYAAKCAKLENKVATLNQTINSLNFKLSESKLTVEHLLLHQQSLAENVEQPRFCRWCGHTL